MTVASYTGEINTNGEWATIASLTSFTFVEDTPYWIQVQNIAEIKIASAEFIVYNEKFKYTQLEDDIYIRTNGRVVLTILETTESSGAISSPAADTNLSNITNTGIGVITGLAMPSAKYDTISTTASGTQYTAPADGWYFIGIDTTQSGGDYTRIDWEDGFWLARNIGTYSNEAWMIPVRQGAKLTHSYGANVGTVRIRFYYCYNNNA